MVGMKNNGVGVGKQFKEKMPEWLREIEAKKQQEQLDKDNDNAETLKKLAPLFKKERYYNRNRRC